MQIGLENKRCGLRSHHKNNIREIQVTVCATRNDLSMNRHKNVWRDYWHTVRSNRDEMSISHHNNDKRESLQIVPQKTGKDDGVTAATKRVQLHKQFAQQGET